MKYATPHGYMWLLASVVMMSISPLIAQEALPVSGTIYYQVTYNDGTVKQFTTPPATDAGIESVSRVARYEPELPSYETASTGNAPVEDLNPGRTVTTEMVWNGSEWVSQVTDSPIKEAIRRRQPAATSQSVDTQKLAAAMDAVNQLGGAVNAAANALDAADPAAAKKAKQELFRAQQLHQQAMAALIALQSGAAGTVGTVENTLPAGLTPSGRILTGEQLADDARGGLPLADGVGVTHPIAKAGPQSHRVQVWKVPAQAADADGKRLVRVAMAHPAAGQDGAFRYVAYGDTDGDGQPDKLLAVSPVASASEPGGWTSWAFQTDAPAVYVGNAWQQPGTKVYGQQPSPAQLKDDWRTLDSDVWFSGALGADFAGGAYMPWISNIRIHTQRPNPDYDTGPRVIIREEE